MDRPYWETGKWPVAFGDEITHDLLEDLRKRIFISREFFYGSGSSIRGVFAGKSSIDYNTDDPWITEDEGGRILKISDMIGVGQYYIFPKGYKTIVWKGELWTNKNEYTWPGVLISYPPFEYHRPVRVKYNGTVYKSLKVHKSSSSFENDLAAGCWQTDSVPQTPENEDWYVVPNWQANTEYWIMEWVSQNNDWIHTVDFNKYHDFDGYAGINRVLYGYQRFCIAEDEFEEQKYWYYAHEILPIQVSEKDRRPQAKYLDINKFRYTYKDKVGLEALIINQPHLACAQWLNDYTINPNFPEMGFQKKDPFAQKNQLSYTNSQYSNGMNLPWTAPYFGGHADCNPKVCGSYAQAVEYVCDCSGWCYPANGTYIANWEAATGLNWNDDTIDKNKYPPLHDIHWGNNCSGVELLLELSGEYDWVWDDEFPFNTVDHAIAYGEQDNDLQYLGQTYKNGVTEYMGNTYANIYMPAGTWRKYWKYSLGRPHYHKWENGEDTYQDSGRPKFMRAFEQGAPARGNYPGHKTVWVFDPDADTPSDMHARVMDYPDGTWSAEPPLLSDCDNKVTKILGKHYPNGIWEAKSYRKGSIVKYANKGWKALIDIDADHKNLTPEEYSGWQEITIYQIEVTGKDFEELKGGWIIHCAGESSDIPVNDDDILTAQIIKVEKPNQKVIAWGDNDKGQINVPYIKAPQAVFAGYKTSVVKGSSIGFGNEDEIEIPEGLDLTSGKIVISHYKPSALYLYSDGTLWGFGVFPFPIIETFYTGETPWEELTEKERNILRWEHYIEHINSVVAPPYPDPNYNDKIIDIGLGDEHIAVVTQNGRCLTFGYGIAGDTESIPEITIPDEAYVRIACGKTFNIAVKRNTNNKYTVLVWGSFAESSFEIEMPEGYEEFGMDDFDIIPFIDAGRWFFVIHKYETATNQIPKIFNFNTWDFEDLPAEINSSAATVDKIAASSEHYIIMYHNIVTSRDDVPINRCVVCPGTTYMPPSVAEGWADCAIGGSTHGLGIIAKKFILTLDKEIDENVHLQLYWNKEISERHDPCQIEPYYDDETQQYLLNYSYELTAAAINNLHNVMCGLRYMPITPGIETKSVSVDISGVPDTLGDAFDALTKAGNYIRPNPNDWVSENSELFIENNCEFYVNYPSFWSALAAASCEAATVYYDQEYEDRVFLGVYWGYSAGISKTAMRAVCPPGTSVIVRLKRMVSDPFTSESSWEYSWMSLPIYGSWIIFEVPFIGGFILHEQYESEYIWWKHYYTLENMLYNEGLIIVSDIQHDLYTEAVFDYTETSLDRDRWGYITWHTSALVDDIKPPLPNPVSFTYQPKAYFEFSGYVAEDAGTFTISGGKLIITNVSGEIEDGEFVEVSGDLPSGLAANTVYKASAVSGGFMLYTIEDDELVPVNIPESYSTVCNIRNCRYLALKYKAVICKAEDAEHSDPVKYRMVGQNGTPTIPYQENYRFDITHRLLHMEDFWKTGLAPTGSLLEGETDITAKVTTTTNPSAYLQVDDYVYFYGATYLKGTYKVVSIDSGNNIVTIEIPANHYLPESFSPRRNRLYKVGDEPYNEDDYANEALNDYVFKPQARDSAPTSNETSLIYARESEFMRTPDEYPQDLMPRYEVEV